MRPGSKRYEQQTPNISSGLHEGVGSCGREPWHRHELLLEGDGTEATISKLPSPPIEHGIICLANPEFNWPEDVLKFQPSTPLANWTGQPAMSVPLHSSEDGLPIGVQFFGRYGDEDTLFSLAAQMEQEKPWFDKQPAI